MGKYILGRLLRWVPTILMILLVVYSLAYFGAGDPIKLIFLRAPGDVIYDEARIEAIREEAGLDRPFLVQFGDYVLHLLRGDMGNSIESGRPVGKIIAKAFPVTLKVGLAATLILTILGVIFGIIAALNHNKWLDNLIMGFTLAIWGIPVFVSGPLLMIAVVTIFKLDEIPYGWNGLFSVNIILPLITLSLTPMALVIRQARAAVLEVLGEDYIRTAKSKGIPDLLIISRYIMRPVLTPVFSQVGLIVINMLNNAVLIETVFGLPGLGRLTVRAVTSSDYPVIMAIVFIGGSVVMTVNLLIDLFYPLLDPRVLNKQEAK